MVSEWSTIFGRVWSGLFCVACSFLCPAFSDGVVKAMVKLWSRISAFGNDNDRDQKHSCYMLRYDLALEVSESD